MNAPRTSDMEDVAAAIRGASASPAAKVVRAALDVVAEDCREAGRYHEAVAFASLEVLASDESLARLARLIR